MPSAPSGRRQPSAPSATAPGAPSGRRQPGAPSGRVASALADLQRSERSAESDRASPLSLEPCTPRTSARAGEIRARAASRGADRGRRRETGGRTTAGSAGPATATRTPIGAAIRAAAVIRTRTPAATTSRTQNQQPRDWDDDGGSRRSRRRRSRDRQNRRNRTGGNLERFDTEPVVADDDVLVPARGILDVLDNYAFVRTSGYLPGPEDAYVSLSMVKKFGLRKGDVVTGVIRAAARGRAQGEVQPARSAGDGQRRRSRAGPRTGSSSTS